MTVVGNPIRSRYNRLLLQRRVRDHSLTALQLRSSARAAALKKTVEISGRGKILDSGMLEATLSEVVTKFCSISPIVEGEEDESWKYSPRDGIFTCRLILVTGVVGYIRK